MDDQGVEDAAILLMSLGEEEAAEVFKHLAPKEVQRLGETIAKMKAVSRERVDGVLDKFTVLASDQSLLVSDTDEYVKTVLRKALGEDKANLLIDRILQGSDVTGIESLKWMDAQSVAELRDIPIGTHLHIFKEIIMLTTETPVSRFFALYARETAEDNLPAVVSHFAETFLFAGPSGAQPARAG